jgi:hypothetical protein
MDQNHFDLLRRALSALNILSPTTFSFAGQMFNGQVYHTLSDQTVTEAQNPTISRLAGVFYSFVYTQRFKDPVQLPSTSQEPVADDLIEMLSRANASRERWDANWQISQALPSGQVIAIKHGVMHILWPGEFITHDGPGIPPRIGSMITVFSARESRTVQPGFYFVFGETQGEQFDPYDTVRFYWNVRDSGAAELVQAITRRLNRFLMPFRFKICSRRVLFSRLDSAVLYVSKRHYRVTAEALVDVYRGLLPYLETDAPIFTRPLAPGLAFAEEPGTGESFGTFCCRLVAEGIWNAHLHGTQDPAARIEAIQLRFQDSGVDFERPYLRPGSSEIYEIPIY